MNNDTLGIILACLCCLVPWAIGFFTAWLLRLRVYKNGWRAALLPKWVLDQIDILMIRIREEE